MSAPMSLYPRWCWHAMGRQGDRNRAASVTHARLRFNNSASGYTVTLVVAAAGPLPRRVDVEPKRQSGCQHTRQATSQGIKVFAWLHASSIGKVSQAKSARFAPPLRRRLAVVRAVVIEIFEKQWIYFLLARGYVETGKTRSNTLLVRRG